MKLSIEIYEVEYDWIYPPTIIVKLKFNNKYIRKSKTFAIVRDYLLDNAKYILKKSNLRIKEKSSENIIMLISIRNNYGYDNCHLIGNVGRYMMKRRIKVIP